MSLDSSKVLISLQDAKRYLGKGDTETADDRLIDAMVQQASVMIRRELGCDIIETTYTKELYSGDGGNYLYLNNWPLTDVSRVAISTDDALTVSYTGTGTHAQIQVTSNAVKLRQAVSGTWSDLTFVLSDYTTVDDVGDAIDAVTGWGVTVSEAFADYPSSELLLMPAKDANDLSIYLKVPESCEIDYGIEDAALACLYHESAWRKGHLNIVVDYTAGYARESIPEPLQAACMELVAYMYNIGKHDPTLRSEQIGEYRYSLAGSLDVVFGRRNREAIGMVSTKIDPYRRIMFFGA